MLTAEIYRQQADAARRAARKARSPSQYLMRLAENYDAQADEMERSYAGDRPSITRSAQPANANTASGQSTTGESASGASTSGHSTTAHSNTTDRGAG